ncbi:hypothetical protein [Bacillus marinisedimentorum]|uniref:hypothetical protein n=1 Tax=Bacillus marinisedimentorum TaxID=1821260 RepID=UPI0008723F9C|nr:hypothetical protein [Bacillus marinisedimentorum]
MKKHLIGFLIITLGFLLIGCTNTPQSQEEKQTQSSTEIGKRQFGQKVIIMDSVNDPLPPEAENIYTMPGKNDPQQLPNVDLSDPIVITKMPYSEKNAPPMR